jgi:phosphoinositide-3-kinase regulatory subunit 4
VCSVDNSHSVATASADGSVHVWRVDLASDPAGAVGDAGAGAGAADASGGKPRRGAAAAAVRVVDAGGGPAVAVAHFGTELQSVLAVATQHGGIRGLDLRSRKPAWALACPPELGVTTSMAVGTDKLWLTAGTSRGFVTVWDLRYGLPVKLWRHSCRGPVHRLATCARLPVNRHAAGGESAAAHAQAAPAQPLAFLAAGKNEAAVFDLVQGGPPRQLFRAAPAADAPTIGRLSDVAPADHRLPWLYPVALPSRAGAPLLPVAAQVSLMRDPPAPPHAHHPSVRALMGRISVHGNSYLITGGSDRLIRYWDFSQTTRCYNVSGLGPAQPRPSFDAAFVDNGHEWGATQLVVSYDREVPREEMLAPSQLPVRDERGPITARAGHDDAVLDLKGLELPFKMCLSSSRDGMVTAWR